MHAPPFFSWHFLYAISSFRHNSLIYLNFISFFELLDVYKEQSNLDICRICGNDRSCKYIESNTYNTFLILGNWKLTDLNAGQVGLKSVFK